MKYVLSKKEKIRNWLKEKPALQDEQKIQTD